VSDYLKALGFATAILLVVTAVASAFWSPLRAFPAVGGILLMGANAWAAIAILRLPVGIEPLRLVMTSMLIRLGVVAAVMLVVIAAVTRGPIQAVEIRHVLRHPELLAR
jgi:hypothetical protein